MTSTSAATGPDRLAAALAEARVPLREVVEAAGFLGSVEAPARHAALTDLLVLRRLVDAALLRVVDSFGRLDLDALGAASLVDLLGGAGGLPASAAKRLEQVARATGAGDTGQPPMPAVTAVHAEGRISTEVFELAARTLRALPRDVRREVAASLDQTLAEDLPGLTHEQAVQLCADLLDVLDPSRADGDLDPDALTRRRFDTTVHADGWVAVRGLLDPVAGAQLIAVIDHYSRPQPQVEAEVAPDDPSRPDLPAGGGRAGVRTLEHDDDGRVVRDETTYDDAPAPHGPDGPRLTVRDERSASQRRADALGLVALQGADPTTTRGGEPPRIIVTATEAQVRDEPGAGRAVCEQTGPLPRAVLRTLLSRAVIQAVVLSTEGADASVLALGQSVRCFTPPQRRALYARDGGCAVPGCDAHLGWLQAHHVHDWALGGDTDLDNGVLLCPRHHLQVTLGHWEVRMVDGVPQLRAPATVDPLRRWLVNPRRAVRERARRRGQRLLFGDPFDDPPDGPPGHALDEQLDRADDARWRFAATG